MLVSSTIQPMWVVLEEAEPSRITQAVELLSEIRVAWRFPGRVNAQEIWRLQLPETGGGLFELLPDPFTRLESMVTAPMRARARPSRVAPVCSAMLWSAKM